jgi:hypothetical protein
LTSALLDTNIEVKRITEKMRPIVLAPYSFLFSSPKDLRRNESERFTAVPKQTQRSVAIIERLPNEDQNTGIAAVVRAKRILKIIKNVQRFFPIFIERKLPMIAHTAEYRRIIVASELLIPKVALLYSTEDCEIMVEIDQKSEDVTMTGR